MDGVRYRVLGKREAQQDELRYLRLPLDAGGTLATYRRVAAALADPAARRRAAGLSATQAAPGAAAATEALLEAFARGGYRGLAELVQSAVPAAEQLRAGRLYAELLAHAAHAVAIDASRAQVDAILAAYSDSVDGHFPVLFEVAAVRQVQASALQVTRAPGALLVYLGAGLLAVGVCCMYFVRERRLWLWLDARRGTLLLAYAGNRDTPLLAEEFASHHAAVAALVSSNISK
jgi:cytochrome c biogenesis protein